MPITEVQELSIYSELIDQYSGVEVWPDHEFCDGGFNYFWIVSRVDGAVRNLAYVRGKNKSFEQRKYDEQGNELWLSVN